MKKKKQTRKKKEGLFLKLESWSKTALLSAKQAVIYFYDIFLQFLQGSFVQSVNKVYQFLVVAKNKTAHWLDLLAGPAYRKYVSFREQDRLWTYQLEKESEKHSIIRDILRHSRWIVTYLVIFFVISIFADRLFLWLLPHLRQIPFVTQNFSLPTANSVEVGLGIFVGAISAILGLIFALYSVGVQQTNERYSERVSDFINRESVSDYFFSFLIFTDIYSILILLKLHLIPGLPFVSFLMASGFVALSLLGILIFRSHYINSLKPLNLLQTIWRICREEFRVVTDQKSYKYKSWSIAIHARDNANRHIGILADLFRDLVRNEKWSDASYAPVILGHITRDYSESKKFIDKDRGWWFFQKYEQVKADDLTMFTIKANYELDARGPLHMPRTADSWLEDKVIDLLEEMATYIDSDKSFKLANRIIDGYKEFLVGDYEEQKGEKPKLIPGAIHIQEFGISQKGLKSFLKLWEKIDFTKTDISTNFINNYFAIAEGVMDEWNLDKAIAVADSFYVSDQLNNSREFRFDSGLPAYTRDILIEYWGRLEVEQQLEGKLVTPKDRFIDEVKEVLLQKRNEILTAYLTLIFDNSDLIIATLYKQKNHEYVGQFVKMQYEWVSRLLRLNETKTAEALASRIKKNAGYLAYLPRQVVIDMEMLEQVEKGFFVSLTTRSLALFDVYAKAAVLVLIIIRYGETDQNKLVRSMKLPLIWGGLAYLISEYEQDFRYVITLTQALEKSFVPGSMIQALEAVADLHITANIFWETTRYSSWYMGELNRIQRAVGLRPYRERGAIGYSEIFNHPSPFIQQLAQWEMMAEERCGEGFIDWLKKREEVKKLVSLVSKMKK
ncbi:MAG: DUF2254 family protein [Patescibacteria group bacterium]|jgi:hypothetical protein